MVERGVTNLIHDLGPTAGGYKVTATGYSPATSEEEQTRFNGGLSESKQRKHQTIYSEGCLHTDYLFLSAWVFWLKERAQSVCRESWTCWRVTVP